LEWNRFNAIHGNSSHLAVFLIPRVGSQAPKLITCTVH
jgi:hypothetical protein